jgi:anti-sigma regulatory factor (Ser/Thr protein kinase)/serine/threonine protein phosphatase PrpC
LTDRSSVGEARRVAANVAQLMGFDEQRRNDIAIVVTETANNIVLHATSGELLICPSEGAKDAFLDIIGLDNGPGIMDIPRAMEDGFSSIGTPGQGLGAISRLSDDSSLYSIPEKGTLYWSRFFHEKAVASSRVGVISIPVKGETACGDGYFALPGVSRSLYVVVDGLGHGAGAAEAAEEALSVVQRSTNESAAEIIVKTHDELKKTRGAAMSVAVADHEQKILTYAGVGNIGATLMTAATSRSLVSQNGTLGAMLPRVQEYTYPIERNSLLLMFSDGLTSKASISSYPGLQSRPPILIAGVLYRDFTRKRDDATVLIARMEEERA